MADPKIKLMKLRGDGININRYRASKEDDSKVLLYLDVVGEHTVAELVGKLAEIGANPLRTTFRGGCFVITMPSTPEDREAWRQRDEQSVARAKQSRREWYERLKAEFEGEEALAAEEAT